MAEHHWTDRLSEYLDGELGEAARLELESHLAGCDECSSTLAELRGLVAAAAALPELPPERDLWGGIEARLTPRGMVLPFRPRLEPRGRRRIAFTVPQLIAAGIAVVALSAGGVYAALELGPAAAPSTSSELASVDAPAEGSLPAPVARFTSTYEHAIEELQTEFDARRDQLSPSTVDVVERNLALIDAAIAEARAALAEDPSSGFLSTHLSNVMRRKVDLLRRAATLERAEI